MYFKSKKVSLLILAVTALACSRIMFLFFDDPEGPNLLVVAGTAAVLYVPSLAIYAIRPSSGLVGLKRLLLAISIQVLIAAGLYLCFN